MQSPAKEKEGKKENGRWTAEEHDRFMLGIFQHGKDWKKVEQVVGTRNGSQVRSHAQKFFNRLQKEQKFSNRKQVQQGIQMSQTQNDFFKGIIQEQASLNTPLEIVSLIRKQSRQDRTVNVKNLIMKLQSEEKQIQEKHQEKSENPKQQYQQKDTTSLKQQQNSFKSMTNILNAYQNINQDKKPVQNENESFLILLTKKYKKFFAKGGQFENLIDFGDAIGNANQAIRIEKSIRKRSFTLLEGQESDDQRLQTIRKKIKADRQDENFKQKQSMQIQQNKKNNLISKQRIVSQDQNGIGEPDKRQSKKGGQKQH